MAAATTSNLADILPRSYTHDSHFYPFEQAATPYYDELEQYQNEAPQGVGIYFSIWLADPQATASIAESGDLPTSAVPTVAQGSATAIQTFSTLNFSELFLSAAANGGSIDLEAVNQLVQAATRNTYFELNRQMVAGHGTGRLGVVQTTTSSATTVVMRNPEGVLQFRVGMKADAYDTDTGGSKQGSTLTVTNVDVPTRTLTFSAAASLTAGWGLYRAASTSVSAYGIAMNGLWNIIDNGTRTSTLFGITRSSQPNINAVILTAGGGTQPWSEALVRKSAHLASLNAGTQVNECWLNVGILGEHLNQTVSDRIFDAGTGPDVPTYNIGYKKYPGVNINGKFIPYRIDEVFPARTFMLIDKNTFKKTELRKVSWVGDGTGESGSRSPVLMQQPGAASGTYATAKIGGIGGMTNQICRMPKGQVGVFEIADYELSGDES